MSNKLLYIAREPQLLNSGGSNVDQRNLRTLRSIYGKDNVIVAYLPKTSFKCVMQSLLELSSYGVSRKLEKRILQLNRDKRCNLVFIEGSFCGRLVKKMAKQGCKVIIHMHNVEVVLYKERLRTEKNLISYIKYNFIKYNEAQSIKYASAIINLNDRDGDDMFHEYGRKSDLVLPITFPNRHLSNDSVNHLLNDSVSEEDYLLFVGSDFFPNIEGLLWFFNNVAPYVKKKIKIVGGCCKNQSLYNSTIPQNVELVGYVDNLDKYYLNASAVIAPIFHGSGMKTKTIEAMSFGKTIIGTDEAFIGIDNPNNSIGFRCNTAREFIESIDKLDNYLINSNTLETFEKSFTDDVFKNKLELFLKTLICS